MIFTIRISALLLVLPIIGCVAVPTPANPESGHDLRKVVGNTYSNKPLRLGASTSDEVAALLGEPAAKSTDGRIVVYSQQLFSGFAAVLPPLYPAAGPTSQQTCYLRLEFDENAVLSGEILAYRPSRDAGMGYAVQAPEPIFEDLLVGTTGETIIVAEQKAAASRRAAATSRAASRAAIVNEFQGEHRFLSNFWPAEVEFEGMKYPSVEHAYQAAKTLDIDERKKIAALPTPAEAKAAGRALGPKQRADWEQVKFDVMEICVRYKFTHHPELREKLLATGDVELIEGNTWGDQIWGVYQGKGDNRLGKILMKVRAELRKS